MFTAAQLAYHLSLAEFQLFSIVPKREYLHTAWSQADQQSEGKRFLLSECCVSLQNKTNQLTGKKLVKLIGRFNAVSFWVATSILTCGHTTKKRLVLQLHDDNGISHQ